MSSWKRTELLVCNTRLSLLERSMSEPESGASILMLHGMVAEAETLRKLGDLLPVGRRVAAVDLPGMGFSERSESCDASFGGVAAMVREVMVALNMERPILVGHSYGGAIALRLAAFFPELPQGMILMSPAHPFSGHEDKLVRFYLSPVGRVFAHSLPMLPRALYLAAFRRMPGRGRQADPSDIEPYLHTLRTPGTITYALRLLRSWHKDMTKLGAAMEEHPIPTPTLLLWGDKDVVVPISTAANLLKHFQTAKLMTLSGVGHLPNEEAPEECGDLIRTWLRWLATSPKNAQPSAGN